MKVFNKMLSNIQVCINLSLIILLYITKTYLDSILYMLLQYPDIVCILYHKLSK